MAIQSTPSAGLRKTSSAQQTKQTQETQKSEQTQKAREEEHPSIDSDDGFEASGTFSRPKLDRVSAEAPKGDPSLAGELSALRAGGGHSAGGGNGIGKGLNGTNGNLRSASGRIPASSWDNPERIVGRLTQNPARGSTASSGVRCAAANVLGASLMNGPASAATLLDNSARSTRLTAAERTEMGQIAGAVRGRTATFEQLGRAQDLLYRSGNTRDSLDGAVNRVVGDRRAMARLSPSERGELRAFNPNNVTPAQAARAQALLSKAGGEPVTVSLVNDEHNASGPQYYSVTTGNRRDSSGFDDHELQQLSRNGGGSPTTAGGVNTAELRAMEDVVNRLQPGQSATFRVAARPPDATGNVGNPDHFITLGRRPNGQAYVYNSDPARGDHTLFTGSTGAGSTQPQAFRDELRRYDARISFDGDGDQPNTVTSSF